MNQGISDTVTKKMPVCTNMYIHQRSTRENAIQPFVFMDCQSWPFYCFDNIEQLIYGEYDYKILCQNRSKPKRKGVMMKFLLGISMVLLLALGLGGCATTGDLEDVRAREKVIDAKADQAIQDAQAAKAAASEAQAKADAAAARAEEAVKKAEEREQIAAEKEKQAEALFQKSMKK
jgi:murein lipoprotein